MESQRLITIPIDYTPKNVELSSYQEVLEKMKLGEPIITHCLNFFSFSSLDKGYNVKVVKADESYIILSELLDNDGSYTEREIRRAHIVERLLLGNAFQFKKHK